MGTRPMRLLAAISGAALGLVATVHRAQAQEAPGQRVVPTNQVVISGYGTVGYNYRPLERRVNEFNASFNPIFLFQFQDRVLFEAEFEFELEEGITETGLEYAQLDFLLHDNVTLVGGKFLLPFGVFGDRLHPTWINKFPTSPPLYGHHVSEFGTEPMLPILADVGVMARGVVTPGRLNLALNAYVVQGPAAEVMATGAMPELEWPASSSDNNLDKTFGARLDVALPPWAELNLSFLNGDYDSESVLDLTGFNVGGEFHLRSFELRGEYIQTHQEIETLTGFPILKRDGFYAQAAYRWKAWEPLARWTQIFSTKLDGAVQQEGAWQAGFGLDYWFNPSIALMAGYELNREKGTEIDNDRIVVHISYGF